MMDRRSFLTGGAVAAGLATLGPASARAEPGARLPAFKNGSRLLFQGDSITDMKWGRNQADRNHYLGHSYVYLLAARLGVDMPQARLEFFNRGHSGNTVVDLKKRWQQDTIEMKPDVLSILIGTNDVARAGANGVDLKVWEADYRSLLDAARTSNPDLRLILLDPFVLPSGKLADKQAWEMRRPHTDALIAVVGKIAGDYDAVHIRTQELFDAAAAEVSPEYWMWDGIHPLPQGHELIARNWIKEVGKRWH